jgi:hypothetical protein
MQWPAKQIRYQTIGHLVVNECLVQDAFATFLSSVIGQDDRYA